MAPRKRLLREVADGELKVEEPQAPPPATTTTRVTRSSTRRAVQADPDPEPVPRRQKRKAVKKGGKDAEKDAEVEEEPVGVTETEQPADEAPAKEAQRVTFVEEKKERTVVIEHCKQCNSFKTRALQVKNGLETGVCGITVLVNPEKPRRGCFEIREEGGETFVSLLDMNRPFKPMKALDMEKVILDIVGKLNGG